MPSPNWVIGINSLEKTGDDAMSIKSYRRVLCVFALILSNGAFAQNTEIDELRVVLDELRADYETRIAALEDRLAAAEQARATTAVPIITPFRVFRLVGRRDPSTKGSPSVKQRSISVLTSTTNLPRG